MKKKKKTPSKAIVTIQPGTLEAFKYENNEFHSTSLKSFKKEFFYVSYINANDIIFSSLEVSKSITDEDLDGLIEIKAYEDLNLDTAIEYKILYEDSGVSDSKNILYNVFIINLGKIQEAFTNVVSKIKYVDYIIPAPFMPKALYTRSLLDNEGVDCFISFQKSDAYLAVYKKGRYAYSKPYKYNLRYINDTFCEAVGERIEEEEFFGMLTSNLKDLPISYQQHLMKLLGEIFTYINDVLEHAKRNSEIEMIDRIFILSEIGSIHSFDEYAKSYLGIEISEFNFNVAKNQKDVLQDPNHALMVLNALDYFDEKDDKYNLTLFQRPPPFFKRPSGTMLLTLLGSTLISFGYPLYQYSADIAIKKRNDMLRDEYNHIYRKAQVIRIKLKQIEDDKNITRVSIKKENDILKGRKEILNKIYEKKVEYPVKSKILVDLFNYLDKYGIKGDFFYGDFSNGKGKIVIKLHTDSQRKISKLMADIAKDERFKIMTDLILRDDMDSVYHSELKVLYNE